jgi:predicted flap endonuclease-1-like 5' DNA nuclease
MAKLERIEGIGPVYADKLREAGIQDTDALLEEGSTPKNRIDLAFRSGISVALILEWVNHVDLIRIKGVGEEYADLLEEAGVDTIPDLARRNSTNLHYRVVEVNREKKLVRRLPSRNQVDNWIAQAKELPRIIQY